MTKKLKACLGLLVVTFILFISLSFLQKAPYFDVYDDKAILSEGDTYFSTRYTHTNQSMEVKDFSGMDTLLSLEGGITMNLTIDIQQKNADLRVLWITPDHIIHELTSGQHALDLSIGTHRIKVVGNQTTFEMTYHIDALDIDLLPSS